MPAADAPGAPPAAYDLTERGQMGRPWKLRVLPDRLQFETAGEAPQEVALEEAALRVEIVDRPKGGLLTVRLGRKRRFAAGADVLEAVRGWLAQDGAVRARRRQAWRLPAIGRAVLWCLLFLAVEEAIARLLAATLPHDPDRHLAALKSFLVKVGQVTFVGLLLALLFSSRSRRVLALGRVSPFHLLLVVLLVLPLSGLAAMAHALLRPLLLNLHHAEAIRRELLHSPWLAALTACVLAPVIEELYFRGFLGRGLVARHGPVLGSCLAALLFGLMHKDPAQMPGAVVFGLGAQFVLLTTRSLFATLLLHALNNGVATALGLWANSADAGTLPRMYLTPLVALITVLAVLSLFWVLYQTHTRWVLADGSEWSPGYAATEIPPQATQAVARRNRPSFRAVVIAVCAGLLYAAARFGLIA